MGYLKIVKSAPGGGPGDTFDFELKKNGAVSDTVTGLANGDQEVLTLEPGDYSIGEVNIPGDWDFEKVNCGAGDKTSLSTAVTIVSGEETECIFTNTKKGQLKIIKSAPGGGPGDTFDFELKKGGSVVDTVAGLANGDQEVLTLQPGGYTVGEVNIPGDWDFEKVNCGAGDKTSLSTAVTIVSGQLTTCTFTNTKKGQLKIIKSAPGGGPGDTFDFELKKGGSVSDTVTGLANGDQEVLTLQPGDYTVGEVNIPGDWDFEKVNCGAGDQTSLSTAVTIVSGQLTTCTFTNTKKGQLKIIKSAPGGGPGDTFDFEIRKGGSVSDTVTGLANGDQEVLTLQPGDYTVGEVNIPGGWDFTTVNCGSGDQTANPAPVTVVSGEVTECTFTNIKKGKLEIEKQSLGGTGSFDITASGVGSPIVYTISTGSSNPNSETKDVAPGTYSISETAPAGWTLDSIVCEGNGSQDSRAVVVSGETTKCTVINKSLGAIKIEKKVVGGNGETFDFTLTDPQSADIALAPSSLGDGGTTTASDLPIGTGYTITEAVPAGWTLAVSGDNCSQDGNTAKAEVKANETTTCVFTNTRQTGAIKIEKKVVGGNGETFDFTLTNPQSANIALAPSSLGDGGTATVSDLPTGAGYTITETVPAGWTLAVNGDNCSQSGNTVTAEVLANETTTCVFTNTRQTGSLRIEKTVVGGSGETFDFTLTDPQNANIALTPGSLGDGGAATVSDLPTGAGYTITETVPAGWTLAVSGDNCSQSGNTVTAEVLASETTTCVFTNTRQTGSIRIEKKIIGGVGGETFSFTLADPQSGSVALSPSSLGDGGATTASGLPTGTGYTITEAAVAGWTLAVSGNNCSQNGNTVTADVLADETTTCVFTNTRQTGDLKIVKLVEGGPAGLSFTFSVTNQPGQIVIPGGDSHTLYKLPTGSYTITETSLPDGWTLKSISGCGDVDIASNSVMLNLTTSGATCTFTNFKEKDDPAEDETRRFIHRRVDNLLTYGPDRARMLRRLQEPPPRQSLKDGALKFSGGVTSGSAGPMMAGRAPMGLMSSPPGLSLGSSSAVLGTGTSGLAYTGPFKYDGVTYFENQEEDGVSPFERRATTSLFGELAGQLMPLASGGSSFKLGTSLSEIRAAAAAAEADKERAKLAEAGLSFAEQPYADRFATLRQGFDVWVEGHIAKYDDSIGGIDREGDFRILYVGADYVVAPGVLIGALVQIDDTEEDIDDPSLVGRIEGTGWMVGPYIGIRLTDNLVFDARAAWGQSENDIALDDPIVGARSGSFDTDRWLASASLTGNEYFGPWRLSPQLQVAYGNEESDAYRTSLGQSVSSTEATIGRLTGTLEVGYRTELENGTMVEPHVAVSGIWNFDTDDLTFNGTVYGTDETRAKIEGGILIQTPEGLGLRWAGSYDGLGAGDYDAYSGSLWVNIPLN